MVWYCLPRNSGRRGTGCKRWVVSAAGQRGEVVMAVLMVAIRSVARVAEEAAVVMGAAAMLEAAKAVVMTAVEKAVGRAAERAAAVTADAVL